MIVTLLGTGCPQCDPARMGPSNLVRHGGHHVLVDCGSGATQRLIEAGASGKVLDAVLLTHLHSDHVVDLFQLILSSWHQGRDRPQRILGPPGAKRFVLGLMDFWRPELDQRIAHEMRSSSAALEIEVSEFVEGEVLRLGALRVDAFAVEHLPVRYAFGFAFAAEGKRAVFSGDTRRSARLIEAARGADLLVHECFIHREMKPAPGRTSQGLANVAGYHTASSEVGPIAREAGVRALALNHFVPTRFDRRALIDEVRRDFAGPLIIGEDLTTIDVAAMVVSRGEFTLAV